jgi:hypothetical protein
LQLVKEKMTGKLSLLNRSFPQEKIGSRSESSVYEDHGSFMTVPHPKEIGKTNQPVPDGSRSGFRMILPVPVSPNQNGPDAAGRTHVPSIRRSAQPGPAIAFQRRAFFSAGSGCRLAPERHGCPRHPSPMKWSSCSIYTEAHETFHFMIYSLVA